MIAEVHQVTLPSGATAAPSDEANKAADEAAHAPGSEQLLSLFDTSTGEGYVIHLWKDRASYDAWAGRRQAITAEAKGAGSKIDSGHIYEVTYRS
jgi:heme-degrading monooxygenase HmoA